VSDTIIEHSNVKISQHAVPVGISDGALKFCDYMMLCFQTETWCKWLPSGASSSFPYSSWGQGPNFSFFCM